MIHIDRSDEPKVLAQERERRLAMLRKHWNCTNVDKGERGAIADFVEKHSSALDGGYGGARQRLWNRWKNKCAYCGREISSSDPIDHFRPRRPYKGEHTGYWWLTWSWSNLLPSCNTCSTTKGSKFPIEGSRMRPWTNETEGERAMLIDPSLEDPQDHLECVPEMINDSERWTVQGKTKRGQKTVEVLGLDKDDERYVNHLALLRDLVKDLEEASRRGQDELIALWRRKTKLIINRDLDFPALSYAYIQHHLQAMIREYGLNLPYPGDDRAASTREPLFSHRPEFTELDDDLQLELRSMGRKPRKEQTRGLLIRLAKLRKWTVAQLMEYFPQSKATLKRHLRALAQEGALVFDGDVVERRKSRSRSA